MSSDAVVQGLSLSHLLYVSSLAPGVPVTEVARIVATARQRNARDGITGLLVFDGATFCQYLEGPPETVDALLHRLHTDPRHLEVQLLVDGTVPDGRRRFSDWRLGYVDSFEHDELGSLRALRGAAALACFENLLPRLDVET